MLLTKYHYTHFRDKETEDCLLNKPTHEVINTTIILGLSDSKLCKHFVL